MSSLYSYFSLCFRYEKRCKLSTGKDNNTILLDIARSESIGPVTMCRALLKVKFNNLGKDNIAKMLRSPHTIDDPQLAANVAQCICSDSQNGPLIDHRRRVVGEEYETKVSGKKEQ